MDLPPTNAISVFWRDLPSAAITADASHSKSLLLKGDSVWLGVNSYSNRLFVRDSYEHIFALLCPAFGGRSSHTGWKELSEAQSSAHERLKKAKKSYDEFLTSIPPVTARRVLLTGTPGIGKSFCFFYLLWQLARAKKSCWYKHPLHMSGNWLFFTYNEDGAPVVRVCVSSSVEFVLASGDADSIVVYDACEDAGVHNATTVVISSPKRSRYKEFQKVPGVALRYLPVWTLEELEACRSICYADISSDVVSNLFAYAGGIARVVLQDQKTDDVVKAVQSADLYKLLAAAARPDAGDDVYNRLLHIHPAADLKTTRVTFPSSDIASEIAERLVFDQGLFCRWFIATVDNPSLQTYRGILFEKEAHFLLRRGGMFRIRRLDGGTSGSKRTSEDARDTVALSPSLHDAALRDAKAVVPSAADTYVRPSGKTFPSVDALLPHERALFQMTVGRDHPVFAQPVLDLVEGCQPMWRGNKSPVRLYFVVPTDIFGSFCEQPYWNADRRVRKSGVSSKDLEIHQYALEIQTGIAGMSAVTSLSPPHPAPRPVRGVPVPGGVSAAAAAAGAGKIAKK